MKERRKPKASPPTGDRPGADFFRVEVLNRQRKVAVDVARLREVAAFVVRQLGLLGRELNVVLLSDRAIRRLNARYLGRPGPTDVLAFSQREGVAPGPENRMLGDVVIGAETAARQASERRAPLNAELDLLVVHGVLHLVGYDHVGSRSERVRMRRAEARMLRVLHRRMPP